MISRRPKAGARGGFEGCGSPPDTIKNYYNNILQHYFTTIFTTVFYNLKNFNNLNNIINIFFILIQNLFKGGL